MHISHSCRLVTPYQVRRLLPDSVSLTSGCLEGLNESLRAFLSSLLPLLPLPLSDEGLQKVLTNLTGSYELGYMLASGPGLCKIQSQPSSGKRPKFLSRRSTQGKFNLPTITRPFGLPPLLPDPTPITQEEVQAVWDMVYQEKLGSGTCLGILLSSSSPEARRVGHETIWSLVMMIRRLACYLLSCMLYPSSSRASMGSRRTSLDSKKVSSNGVGPSIKRSFLSEDILTEYHLLDALTMEEGFQGLFEGVIPHLQQLFQITSPEMGTFTSHFGVYSGKEQLDPPPSPLLWHPSPSASEEESVEGGVGREVCATPSSGTLSRRLSRIKGWFRRSSPSSSSMVSSSSSSSTFYHPLSPTTKSRPTTPLVKEVHKDEDILVSLPSAQVGRVTIHSRRTRCHLSRRFTLPASFSQSA